MPVFLIYHAPPSSRCFWVHSFLFFGLRLLQSFSAVVAGKVSRPLFTCLDTTSSSLPRYPAAATLAATTDPPLTPPRVPSAFLNHALKSPCALDDNCSDTSAQPGLLGGLVGLPGCILDLMPPNSVTVIARSKADDLFTRSRATQDPCPRCCRLDTYGGHLRTTAYRSI